MNPGNSNSEINFKILIESAEKAKIEPTILQFKLKGLIEAIIIEIKLVEQNPEYVFSKVIRHSIIDSMPWDIPFFNELMNFLGEHDKYHKALNKLKKQDIKK